MLLLDDPVSQVDTATAALIVETIRAMAGRKTVLVVSHRLTAVRFADRIVTMMNGRLAETGSHQQLLAAKGYYAQVHHLQELDYAR